VIYRGRFIDVLSLWGEFVDLPFGASAEEDFLDKVVCPNPKHDTTKRHFQVNTKKPLVHCFAKCGISGSYEHAIKTITGCDDREARRIILKHSRVPLSGEVGRSIGGSGARKTIAADDPVAHDERLLLSGAFSYLPREARDWLDGRGIDSSSRGKWQVGWHAEEERVIIPAFDQRGTFRFLIKRRIDAGYGNKYLYTEGAIKQSILFGAGQIDRESLQSVGLVLVEGSIDVIRLHQLGIPVAAGILGTGVSLAQARIVANLARQEGVKKVYLMFDKDGAGVANVMSAAEKIRGLPLFVCPLPRDKDDPGELTGKEAWRSIDRAMALGTFKAKVRRISERMVKA
jgi:hypothetical protein